MMWAAVVVTAAGCYLLKLAGLSVPPRVLEHRLVERVADLIPDMEDLKESMDHNTRVTAELAIAMTRMWELEAIQTLGAGNAGVVDAATVAEERRYMDFTLPSLAP